MVNDDGSCARPHSIAKAAHPAALLDGKTASALVQAYFEFNQLKLLYRQGWLKRGVPAARCESVADHTWGVAVLALFVAGLHFPTLDPLKLLRLALLHEFGEIYAGDITPADGLSEADKHDRERASVLRVLSKLPGGDAYTALWMEYEANQTAEARLVRQLDRLEMALQASVYQRQGLLDPAEFHRSAGAAVASPELRAILSELEAL